MITDSADLLETARDYFHQEGALDSQWLPIDESLIHPHLRIWIENGFHGDMDWMERTLNKRENPRAAFSQFSSICMIAIPYFKRDSLKQSQKNGISLYAQGRDYHKVVWKILKRVFQRLKELDSRLEGRWYCDTGPVSEKWLASQTSLGWIGKNTNLIRKGYGSYFFLGGLLTNLKATPAKAASNHCGNCIRCITHCPTNALIQPYQIDARLCLSYQTIERKGDFNQGLQSGEWMYGCDICQAVCPWNRFASESPFEDFQPRENYNWKYFLSLSEEAFLKEFEGSPIRRIGHIKFLENLLFLMEAQEEIESGVLNLVEKKCQHSNPVIQMLARKVVQKFT